MKQLEKLNLELNFFLALAHKHLGFFMHDRSTAGLFFPSSPLLVDDMSRLKLRAMEAASTLMRCQTHL